MPSTYWGYWLVVMGVAIVGLVATVNGLTTTQTQDYLSIKEITDASMLEAIDYGYYRDYTEVKIDKEKFMEVFIRRVAQTMGLQDRYTINFYDIYEAPPKVSVELISNSGNSIDGNGYTVPTRYSAILQLFNETGGNSGTVTPKPTTPTEPEETDPEEPEEPEEEVACEGDISTTALKGMHGTAMGSVAIYSDSTKSQVIGTTTPGVIFDISGEKGNLWNIKYNGECGWVEDTKMAINLKDYFRGKSGISINITNASSSIMKVNGVDIPGVTGKDLYSSEFDNFVPLTYSFAQDLAKAANAAASAGDTIVVYEAYRPGGISGKVYSGVTSLVSSGTIKEATSDSQCKSSSKGTYYNCSYDDTYPNFNGVYWQRATFINNSNNSLHNYGCAVDVSLSGYNDMPSAMHDLSANAVKFGGMRNSTAYNWGQANNKWFNSKFEKSNGATRLRNYMYGAAGMKEITSEWWHYESPTCKNNIGSPQSFWAA